MVLGHDGIGKGGRSWIEPPWAEDGPERVAIDADLPADHPARRIDELVAMLDLSTLYETYTGSGTRPYRPELMLRVVLYEIHCGQNQPARWARDARENRVVQWLARGIRPSRTRWYEFRKRVGPLLDPWSQQVLCLAMVEGLTEASRSALDGSTIAANASRHKLVNEATLQKRRVELEQAMEQDHANAPVVPTAAWMASTPRGREQQHQRYERAREQMAQRQAENKKRASDKRKPAEKIVVSVSDPQAALGLDKYKVFRPLYNVQLSCDLDSPLILAYEIFAQPGDSGTLRTMLDRQVQGTGLKPRQVLADAGYATALDLAVCDQAGVELYAPYQENSFSAAKRASRPPRQISKSQFQWLEEEQTYQCPQGHRLRKVGQERKRRFGDQRLLVIQYQCDTKHCLECPRQTTCTSKPKSGRTIKRSEYEPLVEALQARMRTPEAKALYKLRAQTVERGFADMKEHRRLRRFSGKGLLSARTEIGLLVLAHNGLALLAARKPKENDTSE
jgi:transposase